MRTNPPGQIAPLDKFRPLANRGQAGIFITTIGGQKWALEILQSVYPSQMVGSIWDEMTELDRLYLVPFLQIPPGLTHRLWPSWRAMNETTRNHITHRVRELIRRALDTIESTNALAAESRAEVEG